MAITLKSSDRNSQSVMLLLALGMGTAIITTLLLLSYVLPVYYRIDPTGLGAKLGLIEPTTQAVGNNQRAIQQNAAAAVNQNIAATPAVVPQVDDPLSVREDTVELTIPARQSLDYRLAMERDYDLDYQWKTNSGLVDTELRGEAKAGKVPSKIFSTLKHTQAGKGFFIIPFNGQFGWHWQNKTDETVTIRLYTKGHYQIVGQVDIQIKK